MTSTPHSQEQLAQYFVQEVSELLDLIEQNLYGLLEEKTIDKVHALMRSAHTIKGSAANLEYGTIETIAHYLEDVFQSLYAEELKIDPELGSLLLEGYECLRDPLIATISGIDFDEQVALERTTATFNKLQTKLGDFWGKETPIPSSTDLGFDVVGSIFDNSILQDLQELEQIICSQNKLEIDEKTRYLAELLQDLGLAYNLPGICSIAQTTYTALDNNPEQTIAIAIAALENFYQARANIIQGDRLVGGEVSLRLQELAGLTSDSSIVEIEQNSTIDLVVTDSEKIISEDNDLSAVESDSQSLTLLQQNQESTQAQIVQTSESQAINTSIPPIDRILQSIWVAEPEPTTTFTATDPKSVITENPESQATIRVTVEQLNNLSQAMGELLINDNLQTLQAEQFQNFTRQTLQQHYLCQQQLNEIYDWWDKQVLRSRHRRRSRQKYAFDTSTVALSSNTFSQFDLIEMDVYSELHLLLQNFSETITQLGEQIDGINKFAHEFQFNNIKRKQALTQAQDNLIQARMVCLGTILERFPRVLKQIVASHNKPAQLELKGTEIFIDKTLSDKLYEPLLHLVRNAYDHGLEDPQTRRQQNKPEVGTISIRACNQGNRTFIEIEDDGRGLNWDNIRQKAVAKGILNSLDAVQASEAKLAEILFQPGFSTVESVSDLSGRGIGLDVVHNHIASLGGRISLDSQVGRGTKFTLQLPLNLTTARLLICQAQKLVYGILSDTIIKIIVPQPDQITQASTGDRKIQTFLRWHLDGHQKLIPIVDLADCITYQYPLLKGKTNSILKTIPIKQAYKIPPLLLLNSQGQ